MFFHFGQFPGSARGKGPGFDSRRSAPVQHILLEIDDDEDEEDHKDDEDEGDKGWR